MYIGANVIIVNSQAWPSAWPTTPASKALIGLGSPQSVSWSALPLLYVVPDGQTGIITSFITHITINSWDTDLMKDWGTVLVTSSPQKCISPTNNMKAKMECQKNKAYPAVED